LSAPLQSEDAERLERCLADGGVAVFPTDTVYGLCCDPDNEGAARRMYALKGRPSARACAVMFFSLPDALAALEQMLTDGEREVLEALLPGPMTLLLANRRTRFGAACRTDPATLGLRVPRLPDALAALAGVGRPLMQTSANRSGEPDARTLAEVPDALLQGADLVLDGGALPGVPSTVIDLRDFDTEGRWHLLREGALRRDEVHEMLGSLQPG
jgi:L-threonylcarbamoyladenylate synthase